MELEYLVVNKDLDLNCVIENYQAGGLSFYKTFFTLILARRIYQQWFVFPAMYRTSRVERSLLFRYMQLIVSLYKVESKIAVDSPSGSPVVALQVS